MRRVKVKADQPDPAHVRLAVEALRRGELVVLPTETVYGLAADPGSEAAVRRLRALKERAPDHAFTHHLARPEQASALAKPLPGSVRRLVRRYWPGPLTVVVEGLDRPAIGLRVPAHPFTARVLEPFPRGLLLSSVNTTGEPPLVSPDVIAARFPQVELLFDAGPPPLGEASAVVRATGPELEVLREGTLGADELLRAAAVTVLFVCSGNTCRSPMAAALARHKVALALGIGPERVLARGLFACSAGTMTTPGVPASENAIAAAREVGLDLEGHRSTPLAANLLQGPGRAYAMTHSHLETLLLAFPGIGERGALLDPGGRDIVDPFGGDLETYRAARRAIDAAVQARLPEILSLLD